MKDNGVITRTDGRYRWWWAPLRMTWIEIVCVCFLCMFCMYTVRLRRSSLFSNSPEKWMALRIGDEACSSVALPGHDREMEKRWEGKRGKRKRLCSGTMASNWKSCGQERQSRGKEDEREREREAGWRSPLEHPQSTSPERYINISHTHKTNGLAHSLRSHRGESEAERKCWRHSVQLHASHFSMFIRRFIRNCRILRWIEFKCNVFSYISSCMHYIEFSIGEYHIWYSSSYKGAYVQFCITQNGSKIPFVSALISSGCDCGV